MKVVVTGGAGFIGAHLTRALLAAGAEVVVLDDLSTGAVANLAGLPVQLIVGSVTDRTTVEQACLGADSIVHLAARPSVARSLLDPMATHAVNATGTLTVLDVAQRDETHVVVASSSSVYGVGGTLPRTEDAPCRPRSPYAASKLAAEGYALGYRGGFGLPVLAVRLFNVFGPYQSVGHAYAAVVPTFIEAALSGRPLTVHGDGRQTRDFTYVSGVAGTLCDAALRRLSHPDPVNIAFGTRTDLLTVIVELERILGRTLPVRHVEPRSGDVRDSQAGTATLRTLFPDAVGLDLAAALEATVAWYVERGLPGASGVPSAVPSAAGGSAAGASGITSGALTPTVAPARSARTARPTPDAHREHLSDASGG
ncbi:NAD-dependent epimerase/dehydratase family protein [Frankia sp. R82]|uniref:NAD-dependent epimerase/dehydratase family protein n=1 Tax=Frankia sp. R82 TaxID=2950553 RepID=UPI00204426B5|nr:NAD-dependent epimerase/dehydratase family protein [Frankia sp. R82]MCM3887577.1 NAD-dependent epimerase/dehydratase family protein [Frankia sp. R82]